VCKNSNFLAEWQRQPKGLMKYIFRSKNKKTPVLQTGVLTIKKSNKVKYLLFFG